MIVSENFLLIFSETFDKLELYQAIEFHYQVALRQRASYKKDIRDDEL